MPAGAERRETSCDAGEVDGRGGGEKSGEERALKKRCYKKTSEARMCSAPQERRSPVGGSPTQIVVGKSGS